jgi:hypothetical protein
MGTPRHGMTALWSNGVALWNVLTVSVFSDLLFVQSEHHLYLVYDAKIEEAALLSLIFADKEKRGTRNKPLM